MSSRAAHLVPRLPAQAWRLIAGMGIGCMGTGYAYSFLVIYLHYERGLSLGLAVLNSPSWRWAALSWRRWWVYASTASARGGADLGSAHLGRGVCASGGSVAALGGAVRRARLRHRQCQHRCARDVAVAIVVHREQRSAAFAVSYAAFSAGLSAGALVGRWFVDMAKPASSDGVRRRRHPIRHLRQRRLALGEARGGSRRRCEAVAPSDHRGLRRSDAGRLGRHWGGARGQKGREVARGLSAAS